MLNLASEPAAFRAKPGTQGRVVLSTFLDREGERMAQRIALRADEGVVVQLD